MTIPIVPQQYDPDELGSVSRCILLRRESDLSLVARSGQIFTFARGTSLSIADTLSATFSSGYAQERYEPRDWLNTGSRTHMGIAMASADRLSCAADFRPRALAFWFEFIEGGTAATANAGLFSISNDAATGAYLIVDSTGTYYRVRHCNGTDAEVSQTLAVAPTSGQRVIIRGQLYADGSVQMWQSINGATESNTARSTAPAAHLAAAWSATAKIRLNSVGTANGGTNWFRVEKIVPGVPDAVYLARAA